MYNIAVNTSTPSEIDFEAVVGLEVHAELGTRSKMFCACAVVDSTEALPNTAVCPVCSGMPGTLPVANRQAVEFALRVALALDCEVAHTSLFARKNYFYPDLPKGYQISQYEYPLAQHGKLVIPTPGGERAIRVRRVHIEEDTGKLTHINHSGETATLVDLNRAGVPLVEIVSEPDMHTVDEVRAYAMTLRAILRYLGVNSGDLEKGVIRFEANVSVRPVGSNELGTRTEIKNLNSFRALEMGMLYETQRQTELIKRGEAVLQETLGWDESAGVTVSQRSKEDAHDYRYFPEPDLPPLVVDNKWIEDVRTNLPELPRPKALRFQQQYGITHERAHLLTTEVMVADYFEKCIQAAPELPAPTIANWITGELFGWMNQNNECIENIKVPARELAALLQLLTSRQINQNTTKIVLIEMLESGRTASDIITADNLLQVSDRGAISSLVQRVLQDNSKAVNEYLDGKDTLSNWFFGQVMRLAGGKADPQVVQIELKRQLTELRR